LKAFRFGPAGKQIAAILHEPDMPGESRVGVVLCNPFGQEAIRAHRFYKVLADRLARDGCTVLRFDYTCTGDSDGEDDDFSLEQSIADARLALEQIAGVDRRLWIFGLRLGGNIALHAAAAFGLGTRALPMDPVVNGDSYLAELTAAHLHAGDELYGRAWETDAALRETVQRETATELLGFPVGDALRAQLRALTPAAFAVGGLPPVAILDSEGKDYRACIDAARGAGNEISVLQVLSGINWMSEEAMNAAVVPTEALQKICALIAGQS
jgi:uncharacterized protein